MRDESVGGNRGFSVETELSDLEDRMLHVAERHFAPAVRDDPEEPMTVRKTSRRRHAKPYWQSRQI